MWSHLGLGLLAICLLTPASWDEVARLRADGRHAEAAAALERLDGDPEALWELARLHLDHLGQPDAAIAALERLVREHPDARPAERARRELAWMKIRAGQGGLDPLLALQRLPDEPAPLRDWLARHGDHPDAWMAHLRLAAELPADEAVAYLEAHVTDADWGWLAGRERARRLYEQQRYADAWLASWRVADPVGQDRAFTKLVKWALPWAAALALALAAWWIRRRRRRASSPAAAS